MQSVAGAAMPEISAGHPIAKAFLPHQRVTTEGKAMANVKKYTIDYDWKAELTVEIDHDVMTDEKLHEINNFWSNADYRLERQGSVLNAVLIMLAKEALLIALSQNYNTYGVVSEFDWSNGEGVEGWPPMDGSEGIKITHVDVSGILDSDDITIKAA